MKAEGMEYLLGRADAKKGVAVAPSLTRHATDKLSKEVENVRQRRKAAEEARLARKG